MTIPTEAERAPEAGNHGLRQRIADDAAPRQSDHIIVLQDAADISAAEVEAARGWNHEAACLGAHSTVFVSGDWLDPLAPGRTAKLLRLVAACPHLDWMLVSVHYGEWAERLTAALSESVGGAVQEGTEERMIESWGLMESWLAAEGRAPANVWLGVNTACQSDADALVPALLTVPARVRFALCAPVLGWVDLGHVNVRRRHAFDVCAPPQYEMTDALLGRLYGSGHKGPWVSAGEGCVTGRLHLVIVGGGAEPLRPALVRAIRDQCEVTGTVFNFIGWGDWTPTAGLELRASDPREMRALGDDLLTRVGWRHSGRLLDGRTHEGRPLGDCASFPPA